MVRRRPLRSGQAYGRSLHHIRRVVAGQEHVKESTMDGASFDQLSRIVHQLGHNATRRQALRTLAGGGLAGLFTRLGTGDAWAACARPGGRCSGGRKCCQGLTCRGGRCGLGNDGGGGGGCGGTTCQRNWTCCTISGVSRCIDRNSLQCCRSAICQKGGDCCGSSCCSQGSKCCGDGRCCPDGWRCGNTACIASRTAGISAESAQNVPFAEPVKGDEQRWIERGWMTAGGTE
jgi:hypothetical protein